MHKTMDEALFSATYVDNYIDSVENLPDDVQRHLSRIRDIDVQYRNLLRDVDHCYDVWRSLQNCSDANTARRARSVHRMQTSLIQAQELGDEKMQIVTQLQELIDQKTRQLDTDQKNLDIKEEPNDMKLEDEYGAIIPIKQTRTQSPARCAEQISAGGGLISNGYAVSNSTIVKVEGNLTPKSERCGNENITAVGNSANGNGSIPLTGGALDNSRANTKRSRRRNDTLTNMELGGNESNSANEGVGGNGSGGNGLAGSLIGAGGAAAAAAVGAAERNAISQKSSNIGANQKKNSAQNQMGIVGGVAVGAAGVGSGVGNAINAATSSANSASGGGGGGGGASGSGGNNNSGKKKKRKARGGQNSAQANAREETPPPDPIDPDEPTYCVCNQISFGEMILCDNDLCPIEWFHFSCVSLVLKPKGKWYCPNCRGDRPNVMKPKAQFLKELERYNKEKEEKT